MQSCFTAARIYRIPHPRWSQLLLDYPKDDEQQVNVITARLFGDVFVPPARLLKKRKMGGGGFLSRFIMHDVSYGSIVAGKD